GTAPAAWRQAGENAAAVRDRVAAERSKLEFELRELNAEIDRTRQEQDGASAALADEERHLLETVRRRELTESTLTADVARREELTRDLSAQQRDLAAKDARRQSLEELETSRATFGDAANYL